MSTVTVELGHLYGFNAPLSLLDNGHPSIMYRSEAYTDDISYEPGHVERFQEQAAQVQRIRNIARFFGDQVIPVVLIDNIALLEEQKKSQDGWRYSWGLHKTARDAGFAYRARTYREGDFVQPARDIVTEIQNMELPACYRLSQDGKKLKLPKGVLPGVKTIQLQGFRGVDDPTYPSCEVLDTAWLQARLTMAAEAITILPSNMAGQQERAAVIADLVGVDRDAYSTVIYDEK